MTKAEPRFYRTGNAYPADPNATLGWIFTDELQTVEIVQHHPGGHSTIRRRVRLQDGNIVVERAGQYPTSWIYPSVKAAKAAARKELKADIVKAKNQLVTVGAFKPGVVR